MGIDDKDYRLDAAIERHQEECPHEEVYVDSINVTVQSRPYGDRPDFITKDDWLKWQTYLANIGTEMFELYATVICEKCGASQEQHIDIGEILQNWMTWEWEE